MFANRYIGGIKIPCVALYIIVVLIIFAYGAYIRASGAPDILEKKVIDHPSCPGFDGWGVTHFLFFGVLGLFYPGHYVQVLLISVFWESIEHLLGQTKIMVGGSRLQLVGDQDKEGRYTGDDENFWYGRFVTDPAFNMAGYILGSEIAKKYWPNTHEFPLQAYKAGLV